MGDEIMALGRAQALSALLGGPIGICDRHGRVRTHPIWRGSPAVADCAAAAVATLSDAGHCRPYIDYDRTTADRWAFKPYRPSPARLAWVTPDPRGAGRILIEPRIKQSASPNKQWGRWQDLIDLAPGLPWAQMVPPGVTPLRGVERIETATFEAAVNVLAAARLAVLPEGGLHHAAAAVGVRAIVLFGGFTGPEITGYPDQINLAVDMPAARGWRVAHPACAEAWRHVTPQAVLREVEREIEREAA
ncbi:MAG: hypothetical protein R8L07_03460 [Alphaproteobacteria bacterium]|nr:hypothetical protein [Alphaproteobacteria bacterium]